MKGLRYWLPCAFLLATAVLSTLPRVEVPIPPAQLQNLPSTIAGWDSVDIAIDPRTVAVARVDSYLNRVYRSPSGEQIGLYLGYYKSQRAGDAVHSPKNCLPGAGWHAVRSTHVPLPLPGGRLGDANLYVVENGHQRYVVLYWYQSHGRVIASEYRAKFQTMRDAIVLHRTDSALVRITVPLEGDEARATQSALSFATLIESRLDDVLPR
jgi:EpsI family protein